MIAIAIQGLFKSFSSQRVLEGVDLQIRTGERVVIMGRSGGGKSVLLKLIIGLLKPDSGAVLVDGQDIVPMDERQLLVVRRKFGMLFQSSALFDSMTVAENVGFALERERTCSRAEIRQKVSEALEMVDLSGTEEKKPAQLSGGMRKRVGLARAIVYRPEILLFDEPTTGLDPIAAEAIDRLIVQISESLKTTSVAVTHDVHSASRIAERIFMLHEGRIHAEGTSEEIFKSSDPILSRFFNAASKREEPVC